MRHSLHGRAIIPYCQTWNRQFAEEMQRRLPVELRNMIYGYIWEKSMIARFPDLDSVVGGSRCVDDGRRPTLSLPHFVDPEFVGLATAREIVRSLYDAIHFTGRTIIVRRPEQIKTAVTKDGFCVGLDPSVHLRSITVHIDVDRLRTPRPTHELSANCQHTPADKVYTKRNELKAWLRGLLYIKHKSGFDLFVDLYQRNIRIAIIEEILDVFGEVHRAMETRGAEVFVGWFYHGKTDGIDWDSDDEPCWDLDDFYLLPRRVWKQNMLGYLLEVWACYQRQKGND